MDIFIASTSLTVGEMIEISCTVTNVSADSITLLRDNQTVAEIRSNTQLNVAISVNDSLHESQFSCEAQLTGSSMVAYSNSIRVTVAGKDILIVMNKTLIVSNVSHIINVQFHLVPFILRYLRQLLLQKLDRVTVYCVEY